MRTVMGHFIGPLVKIPPKVTLAHVVCPARERERVNKAKEFLTQQVTFYQ